MFDISCFVGFAQFLNYKVTHILHHFMKYK